MHSLPSKRFPLYRSANSLVNRLVLPIALAALPGAAWSKDFDWSLGAYTGKYYDTEPAGFLKGDANFEEQYIFALNGSKTVWRSASLPMSVEIDAVLAQQSGLASLTEIAVAPVLRWGGFPWSGVVQTDLRLAPLGCLTPQRLALWSAAPAGREASSSIS